jgi:CRP-like cAMP-binding protein
VAQANDVRTLKAAVDAALGAGKHGDAAQALEKLEKLEPNEPRWSQRLGDTYRRLNKPEQAVAAYGRAIDRLARGGFLARAIAMAATVASLDPDAKALARTSRTTFTDEGTNRHTLPRPDTLPGRSSVALEPPARPSLALDVPEQTGVRHTVAGRAQGASRASQQVESLPPDELILEDDGDVMFVDDEPARPANPAERRRHASLLRGCQAFARVPGELLDALTVHTSLHELPAGDTVASAGSPADALYLVVGGTVWAGAPGATDGSTMSKNELFAESCLMSAEPHSCDFIATEPVTLLRIERAALEALGRGHEAMRSALVHILGKRVISDLLRSSALFGRLAAATRKSVARAFEVKKLPAGSTLFSTGEPGSGLYVPLTTKVAVTRDGSTRMALPGTPVGQASLVSRGPVEFTARTLDDGVLLYLSLEAFNKARVNAA